MQIPTPISDSCSNNGPCYPNSRSCVTNRLRTFSFHPASLWPPKEDMLSFVAVDLQLEESLQCTFLQVVTVCCLHQPQLTEDLFDTSSANGECHSVYSCDQRVASCKTKAFRVQQGVTKWLGRVLVRMEESAYPEAGSISAFSVFTCDDRRWTSNDG